MVSEISSRISELDLYGQMAMVQDHLAKNSYLWLIWPLSKYPYKVSR
jgi:hypothetical protein